jgi:hypothetical protein
MNLARKNLGIALCCAVVALLIFPLIWPGLNLAFFVPCIVIAYYKRTFIASLRLSLACGLFLDLLSSHEHLGIYATSYCIATALLYRARLQFFADSLSTLPLMTFFFSTIATAVQILLLHIFEKGFALSFAWVVTDLCLLPVCDAIYSFVWFALPVLVFRQARLRT